MSSKTQPFKASIYWNGKKYTITGTQASRYASELAQVHIRTINGNYTSQYLPGMPEIHYSFTSDYPFTVSDQALRAAFTRKMDGTCVMFSSVDLLDGNRGVVARTRGMMPIKDTKWRALETMLNQALVGDMRQRIEKAVIQQNATLVFELWGDDNRHTVTYDTPIALSLHTMIRGKGTVMPWNHVKQTGKWYGIDTVEELVSTKDVRSESLLEMGREFIDRLETVNDPESGLYREEGVILNVEAQARGWQWKFKPTSMEEFHRVARVNVCPITVTHTLWKMVDDGVPLTLQALENTMKQDYPYEAIQGQWAMIEREYWAWMTREDHYFALTV